MMKNDCVEPANDDFYHGTDTLPLNDGPAEYVGDGLFVLFQEVDGKVQSVTITAEDLALLLASTGSP